MRFLTTAVLIGSCFALVACDEEEIAEVEERVRAIKTYVVTEPAGGEHRRFSGSVAASATSSLSFAAAGTVETVNVAQGDAVVAGQVLATLEARPFELSVDEARSSVASAEAAYIEKQGNVVRQRTLHDKGWVAKAALDQAVAANNSAEGELNVARARLATAERNLGNAELTAPFDGIIASRNAEPFQEVTSGTALFQVNANGTMEVVISVPDSVVSRVNPGMPVTINVSTLSDCGCDGRIVEVGAASGAANAVTAKAVFSRVRTDLLPGMSAEVALTLSGGATNAGFLVPITAIAAGEGDDQGYVFVFDEASRTVRRVAVTGGGGVSENLVAVADGVAAGDIVASAGVSFLRDGQTVKLLGE